MKALLPMEPAMLMQVFAPHVSIEDWRERISELKQLRAEAAGLIVDPAQPGQIEAAPGTGRQ